NILFQADAVPDDYPMEIDPPEYSSVSTSYHKPIDPTDPPPSYDELYRDRPVAHRVSESTISTAENPDQDPVTVNPDSERDQDLDRITAAYPVQSGVDGHYCRCNDIKACWQKFPFLCVICGIMVPFAGIVLTIVYIGYLF
ncbi:hypothetical protein MAR_035948, partial [Mya arenaria]